MKDTLFDFIVVGSGCTGAMAAQTLVEHGAKVLMLDVGKKDERYKQVIPDLDFTSIREQKNDQHRIFLGDDFEGIPTPGVKTGAQLTPPRRYLMEGVSRWLPLLSDTFFPMESLAYGGLGGGWGLGCCVFSDAELQQSGMDSQRMAEAYQTVSRRIGIASASDDALPFTSGPLKDVMPAIEIDRGSSRLLSTYKKQKKGFNSRGFYMGKPALALLTEDKGDRKKLDYQDMEFYSDAKKSAYRPWITVDELKKHNNFTYVSECLVMRYAELGDAVSVSGIHTETGANIEFKARKLVLAPGVLGTARIVLRSANAVGQRLPLLSNPYCYVPCIQPRFLGSSMDRHTTGMAQLSLFHDPRGDQSDVGMASIYSYRSLMLFRVMEQAPLAFRDSRKLFQYLLPAIKIMGIHHTEKPGEQKYLQLQKASTYSGDSLKAVYILSETENQKVHSREQSFVKAMRSLGCYALSKIDPGHGSSIHYAGTLPFSEKEGMFTLAKDGRLHGSKSVYVADGSGFRFLPAKGLTLSLMANAHAVAKGLLNTESVHR